MVKQPLIASPHFIDTSKYKTLDNNKRTKSGNICTATWLKSIKVLQVSDTQPYYHINYPKEDYWAA